MFQFLAAGYKMAPKPTPPGLLLLVTYVEQGNMLSCTSNVTDVWLPGLEQKSPCGLSLALVS